MRDNIVKAVFRCCTAYRTDPVFQYDYGLILKFLHIKLPDAYEVHFSNNQFGEDAMTVIGDENGVLIPDELLLSGKDVFAWLYLHTSEQDGETVYAVSIPVIERNKPSDIDVTPVEQNVIDQTIAALNTGITKVENIADGMEQQITDALAAAKESGEFDGFSPIATVSK